MKRMRARAVFALIFALVLTVAALWAYPSLARAEGEGETTGESATVDEPDGSTLEMQSADELVGKRIGMVTGAAFDKMLMDRYDGITQKDISYFNSKAEMLGALKAGKIDAAITDLPLAELAVSTNDGIGIMPEPIFDDNYAYVLHKGSPLTAQVNERIAAYHEDGTIDALIEKWTGADESAKTMPAQDWDTPNGTLMVVMSPDNEPIDYCVGKEPRGMCIELLELVARDLGYGLEFKSVTWNALLNEVDSGKADIAGSSFSITEERKQMVDMTEPFYYGGVVAIVRDTAATGSDVGFFEGLAKSFERTFIVEGRWKMILSGLGVTLLISVSSGALGLALGFLFVLLRRKREHGVADRLIGLLELLLSGLPVVVVLMVFYYVIFGTMNISGIIVAILVFTIIFGTSSGSIMWNAVRAVDVGQTEAGRALGFGDRDTFFLVVLPQAARQFAPLLLSSFVTLIKDTSIVGYITVQDLTRVGDIIRSRTMEAFFPLIAVAVIYFVTCRLLAWLLGLLTKRLEPKDGPRTIKGVEL